MALRRMFSKSITSSSNFLMMPSSSRLLYYDLGMNADDDGYCEHFMIIRMTDASPDDLKILEAKGFVKVFDDKVLIIRDWKENNYLRSDRYTPSKYKELYNENTIGIPDGRQVATQDRLGKDRLGKDIILKDNTLKRDNPIKGDVLVNKVIQEFEEALGFKPTDRKPRFQAYNLVKRLQTVIKDNGKEATEEVSLKAINSYFKWLKKQEWFGMVQTLDTCRRKTDIFVHDYNLK